MNTLGYILNKFSLIFDDKTPMPIEIPNFGRDQMADLFTELGFKKGVEIGVADGDYSEVLMNAVPELELYGIDTYRPLKEYRDYTRRETFEGMERHAHGKLDKFPAYHFVKKLSAEALGDFSDGSIDFVYIDGNHSFEYVTNDIVGWSKKVKPGGIISGHDYEKMEENSRNHVYKVLNAFTDAYSINPWFVLGANEKAPGQIRNKVRSWMWVNT